MKKIFFIALLFVFANSKAQTTPPCWWTPNWDWLNDNNTNWQYYNGLNFIDMGTPFQNPNPSSSLSRLIDVQDYTPAKGWVLFSKDFGCTGSPVSNQLPFFALYNRFTGVIRYFFYNANTTTGTVDKALITLEWNNAQKNTSLLNHSNSTSQTNEKFPLANDASLYPVNINSYAGGGSWYIAEFTSHFDQTTGLNSSGLEDLTKTGADYKLHFKLYEVSTSNVQLAGSFQFNTEVSSFAQSPAPSQVAGTTNPTYQLLTDAKKFLGKVPSEGELKKVFTDFDQQVNTLNTSLPLKESIKKQLFNVLAVFQDDDFRNLLTTAASFAGPAGLAVSGAMSLMDMFIDKPTKTVTTSGPSLTYMAPTISKGSIEMTGTITTTGNAKDFTVQLPGVNHKYQAGNTVYSGLPYYDCPLGILNLQKEPLLQKRSEIKTVGTNTWHYTGTMMTSAEIPPQITGIHNYVNSGYTYTTYTLSTSTVGYYNVDMDYYKIDDNVELALNDASGLNLEEVQYSLVVELERDNSGNVIFDALRESGEITNQSTIPNWLNHYQNAAASAMNTTNFAILSYSGFSRTSTTEQYNNPILDQIRRGVYLVTDIKNNKVLKYATPFISASEFKGTSIRAPKGSKIILKVLARLRPIDSQYEQTPVTITNSYELKLNGAKLETDNSTNSYFPNTCAQESMATDYTGNFDGTFVIPGLNGGFLPIPPILNNARFIVTSGNVNIDASQENVVFVPSQKITLKPQTKIVASNSFSFRGFIDPSQNVSGCVTGSDVMVVNHYFASCNPDPTQRLAFQGKSKTVVNEFVVNEANSDFEDVKLYCYPNPNNGNFNVVFSQVISSGTIEIVNLNGTSAIKKNIERPISNLAFESENLEPGLYFIHFKNEYMDKRLKFIVVK